MEDNNDYLRRELKIPASGDEGLEGDLSESSPVPEDRIKMSRRKFGKNLLKVAGGVALVGGGIAATSYFLSDGLGFFSFSDFSDIGIADTNKIHSKLDNLKNTLNNLERVEQNATQRIRDVENPVEINSYEDFKNLLRIVFNSF